MLTDKYLIKEKEAIALADFLIPMLTWHHDRRASAEQMLSHPWLNMPANYDYRHTKKEFEIMKLKQEMKQGAAGGQADPAADLLLDDPRQEMNELVDSDPELYAPDSDEASLDLGGGFNDDLSDEEFEPRSNRFDRLYDRRASDRSLEPSHTHAAKLKARKAQEVHVNNSFTGPYPLDPTEFSHNDKGANAQFLHGAK